MGTGQRQSVPVTAFSVWLRTGRRVEGPPVEVKFNPWHDREDGRFTFVGQGNYFPRGGRTGATTNAVADRDKAGFESGGGLNGGGGASGGGWVFERDPTDPGNYTIYTVRAGDTLRSIAATRKGLKVSDLVSINKIGPGIPLRAGQRIKLWNQDFLDRVNQDRRRILALGRGAGRGGEWPPNLVELPRVQHEILDTNWRRETRGSYDYWIDALERPREIFGLVSLGKSKRSRRNQARAGGADRRPTDQGGHYVATEFNGPREAFNHFAQDANFNQSAYRVMEIAWGKHTREGRKIFFSIKPHYIGTSRRPDHITVVWSVDGGKPEVEEFPNEPKGVRRGKR